MNDFQWCVLDTETTGLRAPIFVVEVAAQRLRGWEPDGPPFRRLLNQNAEIPPEASRVHGYTREILERDGDEPLAVYRDLADYVGASPVCAYNLRYDWDEVLVPEWQRLAVSSIGVRGVCLYELTQRLLDPVPAGNCKLQTLRQYYDLPARGAHTALGDVETVVDLLQRVLHPLCQARGLLDFGALTAFTRTPWHPSRISFGKYKGRHFREAATDVEFRSWLRWLADSENPRSRAMGSWYLQRLESAPVQEDLVSAVVDTKLVVYANPDVGRLERLIEAARQRLAELEAEYTTLRQRISAIQARLFHALQTEYRQRDLVRLRLDSRRRYLDALLCEGEEEARRVEEQRAEAEENLHAEYEHTAQQAAGKRELDEQEAAEVKQLWRRLVKLFHPDRYTTDPDKQKTYNQLVSEINRARDEGDIDLLREIAQDPEEFIARQGWGTLQTGESEDPTVLERLYESLQAKVLEMIEALDALRTSNEHELYAALGEDPTLFDSVVEDYRAALQREIAELEDELTRVEAEVEALQG